MRSLKPLYRVSLSMMNSDVSLSLSVNTCFIFSRTGCVVNDMNESLVDVAVEDRPID